MSDGPALAQFRDLRMADVMLEFHDGPHATPPPASSGPVFLGIKNLTEDGSLDLSTIRHIADEDFPRWTKRATPRSGDLVFTYEASLHRYAMIPEGFEGCLGRRLALIRPRLDVVDPRFLLHFMLSPEWRRTVEERVIAGATVDRIPLVDFPEFPIRLPPLPTQRRIAAVLSAFDELIEINERRIELLENFARSLYREWFVHYRFPEHKNVEFVESSLGRIPNGWKIRAVGSVAEAIRGRSYRRADLCESGGLPFLNLKCVDRGGGFRWPGLKRYRGSYKESQRVLPGDILVAVTDMTQERRIVAQAFRMPDLGEPFAVPSLDLVLLKPSEDQMRSFLYAALRYSDFADRLKQFANGANVLHLSVNHILEYEFVLPDPRTLANFARSASAIFAEVELLTVQGRRLIESRDLLLPQLVAGELDISSMDLGVLAPLGAE